ncbi:NADAR family protein [Flavobacterium sp. RHBU_3]|uniref:NADAR family protein n=1 Tax=Flavobacterium sp. RHBU_3 TaxID=3391184 RepID=UPI003984FAF9
MKYTIDQLINNKEPREYLFFWGHQPSKDGSITKSCFSQWWEADFTINGITYPSAEHWMMAKKAELFNDSETLEKILACTSPVEAKKLGREVQNYNEEAWLENRYEIVKEGNLHKFSQNADLKSFLLSTGNSVIVEASPVDNIWGIGLAADSKKALNPAEWRGPNLLGFALMEVRDALK